MRLNDPSLRGCDPKRNVSRHRKGQHRRQSTRRNRSTRIRKKHAVSHPTFDEWWQPGSASSPPLQQPWHLIDTLLGQLLQRNQITPEAHNLALGWLRGLADRYPTLYDNPVNILIAQTWETLSNSIPDFEDPRHKGMLALSVQIVVFEMLTIVYRKPNLQLELDYGKVSHQGGGITEIKNFTFWDKAVDGAVVSIMRHNFETWQEEIRNNIALQVGDHISQAKKILSSVAKVIPEGASTHDNSIGASLTLSVLTFQLSHVPYILCFGSEPMVVICAGGVSSLNRVVNVGLARVSSDLSRFDIKEPLRMSSMVANLCVPVWVEECAHGSVCLVAEPIIRQIPRLDTFARVFLEEVRNPSHLCIGDYDMLVRLATTIHSVPELTALEEDDSGDSATLILLRSCFLGALNVCSWGTDEGGFETNIFGACLEIPEDADVMTAGCAFFVKPVMTHAIAPLAVQVITSVDKKCKAISTQHAAGGTTGLREEMLDIVRLVSTTLIERVVDPDKTGSKLDSFLSAFDERDFAHAKGNVEYSTLRRSPRSPAGSPTRSPVGGRTTLEHLETYTDTTFCIRSIPSGLELDPAKVWTAKPGDPLALICESAEGLPPESGARSGRSTGAISFPLVVNQGNECSQPMGTSDPARTTATSARDYLSLNLGSVGSVNTPDPTAHADTTAALFECLAAIEKNYNQEQTTGIEALGFLLPAVVVTSVGQRGRVEAYMIALNLDGLNQRFLFDETKNFWDPLSTFSLNGTEGLTAVESNVFSMMVGATATRVYPPDFCRSKFLKLIFSSVIGIMADNHILDTISSLPAGTSYTIIQDHYLNRGRAGTIHMDDLTHGKEALYVMTTFDKRHLRFSDAVEPGAELIIASRAQRYSVAPSQLSGSQQEMELAKHGQPEDVLYQYAQEALVASCCNTECSVIDGRIVMLGTLGRGIFTTTFMDPIVQHSTPLPYSRYLASSWFIGIVGTTVMNLRRTHVGSQAVFDLCSSGVVHCPDDTIVVDVARVLRELLRTVTSTGAGNKDVVLAQTTALQAGFSRIDADSTGVFRIGSRADTDTELVPLLHLLVSISDSHLIHELVEAAAAIFTELNPSWHFSNPIDRIHKLKEAGRVLCGSVYLPELLRQQQAVLSTADQLFSMPKYRAVTEGERRLVLEMLCPFGVMSHPRIGTLDQYHAHVITHGEYVELATPATPGHMQTDATSMGLTRSRSEAEVATDASVAPRRTFCRGTMVPGAQGRFHRLSYRFAPDITARVADEAREVASGARAVPFIMDDAARMAGTVGFQTTPLTLEFGPARPTGSGGAITVTADVGGTAVVVDLQITDSTSDQFFLWYQQP